MGLGAAPPYPPCPGLAPQTRSRGCQATLLAPTHAGTLARHWLDPCLSFLCQGWPPGNRMEEEPVGEGGEVQRSQAQKSSSGSNQSGGWPRLQTPLPGCRPQALFCHHARSLLLHSLRAHTHIMHTPPTPCAHHTHSSCAPHTHSLCTPHTHSSYTPYTNPTHTST